MICRAPSLNYQWHHVWFAHFIEPDKELTLTLNWSPVGTTAPPNIHLVLGDGLELWFGVASPSTSVNAGRELSESAYAHSVRPAPSLDGHVCSSSMLWSCTTCRWRAHAHSGHRQSIPSTSASHILYCIPWKLLYSIWVIW